MSKESKLDYGATDNSIWARYQNDLMTLYAHGMSDEGRVNMTYDLNKYKPAFLSAINIDANYDKLYIGGMDSKIQSMKPSVSLRATNNYSSEDGKFNANTGSTIAHGYKPYFFGNASYTFTDLNSPHNFTVSSEANSKDGFQYRADYTYTKRF